ncbi:acyl carrier protein [Noviherbaspirillum sedimenti]|uniref:Acyl carrier protein n=1 Tax=Noviherbaspirillum sedimenti TaxID=2320865 RepID=A0A3A3G7V4_9BURK|nr:acyl carrier protein [Noviherbaspirillum sedimenti]RJG03894.1 acyl carrier protein [Noviherbaspirillum sedimenti]
MMDDTAKIKLREFLMERLRDAGDRSDFADDSSLFVSGRLDSLSMTRLVMFLEEAFDIDFSDVDFDVELIDSVNDIQAFVDTCAAQRAGS